MGHKRNRRQRPIPNKEEALRKEMLMKVLSTNRNFSDSRMIIIEANRYVDYILHNMIPEKAPDGTLKGN